MRQPAFGQTIDDDVGAALDGENVSGSSDVYSERRRWRWRPTPGYNEIYFSIIQ